MRPTKEDLAQATGKTAPEVIEVGLKARFCGINPGLYSGAVGHHFARPGNRFWPALYVSGFTPRLFRPEEERELLKLGYGITNIVPRTTAAAAELSSDELAEGGRLLEERVRIFAPSFLAVLGIGAFRRAYQRPKANLGPQAETIGGAQVWVLPNPSGLNAHFNLQALAELFRNLRQAIF